MPSIHHITPDEEPQKLTVTYLFYVKHNPGNTTHLLQLIHPKPYPTEQVWEGEKPLHPVVIKL